MVCLDRNYLIFETPMLSSTNLRGPFLNTLTHLWQKPLLSKLLAIALSFSIWVFYHNHSRITGLQGKGEGIFLTLHYHFPPASQTLRH